MNMVVPPDHPVRQILERQIIPYLVSSKKLKRQPFYIVYNMHVYSRDILAGLIGVGLSTPIMVVAAKALGSDAGGNATLQSLSGTMSPLWLTVVVIAAIALVSLKVYVNRSNADERAILTKTCEREMLTASANLFSVLDETDPMNALIAIKNNMVEIKLRHAQTWPWDYEPAPGIDQEVQARVQRLCEAFGHNWVAASGIQQLSTPVSAPLAPPTIQPA
jgi:hypothetical protein